MKTRTRNYFTILSVCSPPLHNRMRYHGRILIELSFNYTCEAEEPSSLVSRVPESLPLRSLTAFVESSSPRARSGRVRAVGRRRLLVHDTSTKRNEQWGVDTRTKQARTWYMVQGKRGSGAKVQSRKWSASAGSKVEAIRSMLAGTVTKLRPASRSRTRYRFRRRPG